MSVSAGMSDAGVSERARTLGEAIRLQGALAQASAGGLLRLREDGRVDILAAWPLFEGEAPLWLREGAEIFARGGMGSGGARAWTSEVVAGGQIAVVGCGAIGEPTTAAVFLLRERDEASLAEDLGRLELGLVALRAYQSSEEARRLAADVDRLSVAIEAVGATAGHTRFRGIGIALVNEIAARFGCERVSLGMLGLVGGDVVRLSAMSGSDRVVRKTELGHAIEGAMEESLDQDIETAWPEPEGAPMVTRAVRTLAERHTGGCALVLPLRTAEGVVGAVALERKSAFEQREVETLRLLLDLVGARVWERREQDRWVGARLAGAARRWAGGIVGPRHTWAKVLAVAVFGFVCFALFVPTAVMVRAPFVVEPVARGVVPAPYEGFLAEVHVRVGDRVEEGDVLARLDDTALRLQLADELARERAARTRADAARNEGEISASRIAEAEVEQAMARVRLLEHMIDRSEVRASMDGVVITGELEGRVGSPVAMGELLFEIAREGEVRMALSVEEEDVLRIEVGQRGGAAPASEPRRRVDVVVVRMDPVALEGVEGGVFRVIAEPGAGSGWLRPGMEGIARIETGRASYAWVWTRGLRDWFRLHVWW